MLTDVKIRNFVKSKQKGRLSDGEGLVLTINSSSSKWSVRYRFNQKSREMGIGTYPSISLKQARTLRNQIRGLVAMGKDPIAEKENAIRQEQIKQSREHAQSRTFKVVAEAYISQQQEQVWTNKKHGQQWNNTLKTYVYPVIGDKACQDINVNDVLQILKPIWIQKTETATRVRSRIEKILHREALESRRETALAQGVDPKSIPLRGNPATFDEDLSDALGKPSVHLKQQKHPSLDYKAIPKLVSYLLRNETSQLSNMALLLIIFSAGRSQEIRAAQWHEFNFIDQKWLVPAERMKMTGHGDHIVFLSQEISSHISTLPRVDDSPYLFPGTGRKNPFISEASIRKLITKVKEDLNLPHFTMHGFRRSFKNWSASTSQDRDAAELCLAHSIATGTEAHYLDNDAMNERRKELMRNWADYIFGVGR